MLLRLALETRAHHAQADADRLAVMDATTTVAYRTFLARVFGFEVSLEHALASVGDLEPCVVASCAKAERIRHDLLALGMTDHDIVVLPRCSISPPRSAAAALGWMFVNERLTLLSGLIRRHLASALPAEMETAASYLHVYGDASGRRFRELGEIFGQHARRSAAMPEIMVAAAHDAFHAQRQWFSRVSRFRPAFGSA